MPATLSCPRCGAPAGSDSVAGHCPVCLLLLGLSASPEATNRPAASSSLPRPAPPARFFGDYELLEEIARGGMGIVYRARQLSLNRLVALKMLPDGPLASPGFIERFQMEAEAAARLNHPNIVPIYEIGEHEGRHFFSMELIEGGDLRARIDALALPACERETPRGWIRQHKAFFHNRQLTIAQFLRTIALAVHHAHERGILHRDLKPANILCDAEVRPHVTDFGLAKLVTDENFLTRTGTVLGTPAYMAPEQTTGDSAQLTTAADIYSLGAIFYHLLTGRPPFQASSALETMRQAREDEPVNPLKLNSAISRDLATICLKCLGKDPRSRYPSAKELADDLECWSRGDTILARPATRVENLTRWCRRKPALAGLTAAVILLLVAVVIVSTAAAFRIEHSRQVVVATQQKVIAELWQSYLEQARAHRWSGRSGRRVESLRAINNAVAIRPSLELRNEAIASLTLPDLYPLPNAPRTAKKTDRLAVDFCHDRYLLAETDGPLSIRGLGDQKELFNLPRPESRVEFAYFSPDGRLLLLNCADGSDCVWDVESRKVIWQHREQLAALSFSADSKFLAYSTADAHLVVMPLHNTNGSRTFTLPGTPNGLYWSANGESLAGIASNEVFIINSGDGEVRSRLPFEKQPMSLAWHPNSKYIAEGGDETVIRIVDVVSGKQIAAFEGHVGDVTSLSFNPDGTLLASDSWDGTLRLWDFATMKNIVTVRAGPEGLEFSPDGRRLLAYCWSQSWVDLFEVFTNEINAELTVPDRKKRPYSGCALLFGSKGGWLALSEDNALALWDVASNHPIARWEGYPSDTLQKLPGGRGLFGWTPDGFYRLFPGSTDISLAGGEPERFIPQVPSALASKCPPEFSTKFQPDRLPERSSSSLDGRVMALAYKDRCYVFNMEQGSLQAVTDPQPWMKFVAVSPDGRWVATGGWHNPNVRVWSAATGEQETELPTETMANVAFSPDGQWLVSSTGAEYRFWHSGNWRPSHRLPRALNGDLPGPMAFSTDGELLALTDTTRNVHFISPATGKLLGELEPLPDNEIIALAFSPDASELALTRVAAPPQIWHLRKLRKELAVMRLDW